MRHLTLRVVCPSCKKSRAKFTLTEGRKKPIVLCTYCARKLYESTKNIKLSAKAEIALYRNSRR